MNRSSERETVVRCFSSYYEELKECSFEDESKLKNAIEKFVWKYIFRDFSPRTLTVKSGAISLSAFRKKCIDFLTINYYHYFHNDKYSYYKYDSITKGNPCNNFEEWHKNMCNSLLALIGERYQDKDKNTYSEVEYGKAQKIINITFKYLYCFDCAKKYIHKFEPCHITIDSVIIDWFADVVLPKLPVKEIRSSETVKWSKKFQMGSENQPYTYLWYQKQIKVFLKENYLDQDNKPLTPFIVEFYAWPEEQWIKTTKKWLSLDFLQDNFPEYYDDNIANKLDEVLSKVNRCKQCTEVSVS